MRINSKADYSFWGVSPWCAKSIHWKREPWLTHRIAFVSDRGETTRGALLFRGSCPYRKFCFGYILYFFAALGLIRTFINVLGNFSNLHAVVMHVSNEGTTGKSETISVSDFAILLA